MRITWADTDAERTDVQQLFSHVFTGIEDNAVPLVAYDYMYAPLIAQIRDDDSRLVAAAMTCRTQVAAGSVVASRQGLPDRLGVLPLIDKHSELDLLAVDESHRGLGYGSALLDHLESALLARGVRAWFGNVTVNLDAVRLRMFYRRHGFTVLPDFEPLPPLLGRKWHGPNVAAPQFWFYKRPGAGPRVPADAA